MIDNSNPILSNANTIRRNTIENNPRDGIINAISELIQNGHDIGRANVNFRQRRVNLHGVDNGLVTEVLNKVGFTQEQQNNIIELINKQENSSVKEFILKSKFSGLYKNSDLNYISALKDMILETINDDNVKSNKMKTIMGIATGDCPTPVVTSVMNHSISIRIQGGETISDIEYSRLALINHVSNKVKGNPNEDQIEIVNGIINAIFSIEANNINKEENFQFKIKGHDHLKKFPSLSEFEWFGYNSIKKEHLVNIKDILVGDGNDGIYQLNIDAINGITDQYKADNFGLIDPIVKCAREIDEELIGFYQKDENADYIPNDLMVMTLEDRKAHYLKSFKNFRELNPTIALNACQTEYIRKEKEKFSKNNPQSVLKSIKIEYENKLGQNNQRSDSQQFKISTIDAYIKKLNDKDIDPSVAFTNTAKILRHHTNISPLGHINKPKAMRAMNSVLNKLENSWIKSKIENKYITKSKRAGYWESSKEEAHKLLNPSESIARSSINDSTSQVPLLDIEHHQ